MNEYKADEVSNINEIENLLFSEEYDDPEEDENWLLHLIESEGSSLKPSPHDEAIQGEEEDKEGKDKEEKSNDEKSSDNEDDQLGFYKELSNLSFIDYKFQYSELEVIKRNFRAYMNEERLNVQKQIKHENKSKNLSSEVLIQSNDDYTFVPKKENLKQDYKKTKSLLLETEKKTKLLGNKDETQLPYKLTNIGFETVGLRMSEKKMSDTMSETIDMKLSMINDMTYEDMMDSAFRPNDSSGCEEKGQNTIKHDKNEQDKKFNNKKEKDKKEYVKKECSKFENVLKECIEKKSINKKSYRLEHSKKKYDEKKYDRKLIGTKNNDRKISIVFDTKINDKIINHREINDKKHIDMNKADIKKVSRRFNSLSLDGQTTTRKSSRMSLY